MIGPAEVAAARDALLAGGLAIVPTDTVYGLAAALDSPAGIDALYALKGRPRSQPCQLLIYTGELLAETLDGLDEVTTRAVRALLPGPVTCIVPDPTGRYAAATGDLPGAVGIRAPMIGGAIRALDIPLVATSANDPGGPDPAVVPEVPARLRRGCSLVLDAGALSGTSSAVVDLSQVAAGGPARLVRPGHPSGTLIEVLRALGVPVAAG